MSKGLFDDLFEEDENRLSNAAKIEKSDRGNLFILDIIETTANFIFTVYSSYDNVSKLTLFFTATLLVINVLPRVMFKMTFYTFLRHNNDSKSFRVFGWIVVILLFVSFGLTLMVLYLENSGLAKQDNIVKPCIFVSMFSTYILGIIDKTVSLLIGKVKMDKEANNK